MRAHHARRDLPAYYRLNRRIHQTVNRCARNPVLAETYDSVNLRIQNLRFRSNFNRASLAGEEARRELRAANLLTAKQKALEKRIVGGFGQEIDGSVAQRMQTAISTAAKGDAAAFNRLMKVVPPELQKETLATALASVTAGKAAGRAAAGAAETVFSPAEFTKVYRGLRANPPVYSQMVKIMGPEWDRASRDLYEISRRIADAQARIPTTGKANQILGEAAVESLLGKVMSSRLAQRAATGVASLVPGGGLIVERHGKQTAQSGA